MPGDIVTTGTPPGVGLGMTPPVFLKDGDKKVPIKIFGSHNFQNINGAKEVLKKIDTVVLATGSHSENALYNALKGKHGDLHILGDAYAPRRWTFATRQAYELAQLI